MLRNLYEKLAQENLCIAQAYCVSVQVLMQVHSCTSLHGRNSATFYMVLETNTRKKLAEKLYQKFTVSTIW